MLEAALSAAQQNNGIDTDRIKSDGEVEKGYTITVPLASEVSASDKKNRKLSGVSFTARLAGAIHETQIKGTLVY